MKIKIKRTVWPSIITLLNMFLGYLAIIKIVSAYLIYSTDGNQALYFDKIIVAGWLIFIAGILDGLDGKVARLVHGSSDFGVEIDSLADILSFIIAPSLLVYFVYASDIEIYGTAIAFIFVIFGTIRLAKFNVIAHRESLSHFIGMPVPLAAITVVSIPMFSIAFFNSVGRSKIILPIVIILGFMMVSNITFKKFTNFSLRKASGHRRDTIIFLVNMILIIVYKEKIVLPLSLLTIFANILVYWRKKNIEKEDFIEIEESDNEMVTENE